MEKCFTPFFSVLLVGLMFIAHAGNAQNLQVSLGNDTTLPCNVNCATLTATLTNVNATTGYTLDSGISFANHYPFTGGSTMGIPIIDDQFSSLVSIPFAFCFYGVGYTQMAVSTNGHVSFNVANGNSSSYWIVNPSIPTSQTSPNGTYYDPPSILPAFHDLYNPAGGTISYYTSGTFPNRKFVVNWFQVPHYNCLSVTSTFQLVLYEGTNVIEFYIQDKPFCSLSTSQGKAISGIFGHSTAAVALPGKNATQWGSSGMNKAYRFTPSGSSLPVVQLLAGTGGILATATPVATANPSFLTATFNNVCLTADSANYIVRVTYPCSAITIRDTIKIKRQITPAPGVVSPLTYCEGAAAPPLTATGQNLLWYSSATGGVGTSAAPVPSTVTAGSYTYYVSQTINGCEGIRDSIQVQVTANPPLPVTSNSPVCEGDTLKLFGPAAAGGIYTWSGPGGFTAGGQQPVRPNLLTTQGGNYTLSLAANGCISSGSVNVTIVPKPVIASVSPSDPTSCGGTDGTLAITGLTTGTSYTVGYSKNGVPQPTLGQTAAGGTVTITGLGAGSYSNITVTLNGCTAVFPGPLLLTDPNAPATPVATNTGPVCAGSSLTLNTPAVSGGTYSWTGPGGFSSAAQNPVLNNAQPAQSGTFAVTVTVNNCTSAAGSTQAVVNPIPVITGVTGSNPTTCQGADGSLSLTGLIPNATYSVNYSKNGNPQAPAVLTADAAGSLTVSGLTAGSYTVISVTSAAGCASAVAGPVTLTDPLPPAAPTAGSNSPICAGGTLNLSATTVAGATYAWTGPGGFSSSLQNPVIANAGVAAGGTYSVTATVSNCNSSAATVVVAVTPIPATPVAGSNSPVCEGSSLNLSASNIGGALYTWTGPNGFTSSIQNPSIPSATLAAAGNYTVTATVNGCISAAALTTAVVNPVPVIASVSGTNPSSCGGTDGSITVTGLSPNTSYTVGYSRNSIPQPAQTIAANASGVLQIGGLNAGSYTNIVVTLSGCASAAAGPVTLADPQAPAAPTAGNNGPLCVGATLNLSASGAPGVSYSWTGPGGYSSTLQNPSVTNITQAQAGNYSVTAILNNCPSLPAATIVVVNPVPVISSVTSTNPGTCGGTNGSISLNGLLPNTVYAVQYTFNSSPVLPANITSTVGGTIQLTGLTAGTYSGITVILNGCSSLQAGPVVLNDPGSPATPAISSNSPVCAGGNINLTATAVAGASYSWTGPGGFSSTVQNPVLSNAQAAQAGTYALTVTVNNCVSAAAQTSVSVAPLPVIASTVLVNPSGCNATNGSISLTGLSPAVSYIVSYVKNGLPQSPVTIVSDAAGNVTLSGLNAATYSNIIVSVGGCSSAPAGPVTLSDPASPAQPVVSNNGPLCTGDTLYLTTSAIPGATYLWNGPGGFSATTQNASVTGVQVSQAGIYSVTATLNNCTSLPATTTVVINPSPAAPVAGSNSPVCEGANLLLTASSTAGASYAWLGPNGISGTVQNPVLGSATAAASGIYTVVASLGNCSSAPIAVAVSVNPVPLSPAVTNQTYCQFASASPLIASGQNLLWYTSPAGGTGSATAPIPSTVTAGIFSWYVSQTVNGCESPRATVSVTVIPQPAAPQVTGSISYCQFAGSTSLAATGQNLLWYTQASGGAGNPTAPLPSTTTAGTTIWYVSQTVGGCESGRAAITVLVNAKPAPPVVVTPVAYCEGTPTAALSASGQNLLWYTQANGGTGNVTAPVPSTSVPGVYYHYVSQAAGGCESERSEIEVVISGAVNANLDLSDEVICQFDTVGIQADTANPLSAAYTWDFNGGVVLSGAGPGPYQIRWTDSGAKTVKLIVSNGACSDSAIRTLTNRPAPHADFVLEDNVCVEDVINVQAAWNALNGATYFWDFDGAQVLSGTGPGLYKLSWNIPGLKEVTLQVTSGGCRSELIRNNIMVHPKPLALIETPPIRGICLGDTVGLSAETTAGAAYFFNWSPSDFIVANGLPQADAIIKGSTVLTLTVTDAYGCSATDSSSIEAKPCCELAVPDAFTPNGDGKNDLFRIITRGSHQISAFRIANRWGQIVFETVDPLLGWDGRFAGEPQDMGTYFYYIRYRCAGALTVEKKGELILVR